MNAKLEKYLMARHRPFCIDCPRRQTSHVSNASRPCDQQSYARHVKGVRLDFHSQLIGIASPDTQQAVESHSYKSPVSRHSLRHRTQLPWPVVPREPSLAHLHSCPAPWVHGGCLLGMRATSCAQSALKARQATLQRITDNQSIAWADMCLSNTWGTAQPPRCMQQQLIGRMCMTAAETLAPAKS